MVTFPILAHSLKQVARAGEALRSDLKWTPESEAEIRQVFQIANNWRDSHALPMHRLRRFLTGKMTKHKVAGVTAARLKRMPSIRQKLQRLPIKLNQIQDLGGCRAIVPSIADLDILSDALREDRRLVLHSEKDYVTSPKLGGYRSRHLIFKFRGAGDEIGFDGRRIEIQIRTRLQHSWATAVEAIGLFLQQDLKAGEGDQYWLRLMELMAAELALAEKCPEPPGVPPRRARVKELIELDAKLHATNTLENLRYAVQGTDAYTKKDQPEYYLITFDNDKKKVTVKTYSKPINGTEAYHSAEGDHAKGKNNRYTSVLVEADKIENLKAAYPNYFGDVQYFYENLKRVTKGKNAEEYTQPPLQTVPQPPRDVPDLSWFKQRRRRWN